MGNVAFDEKRDGEKSFPLLLLLLLAPESRTIKTDSILSCRPFLFLSGSRLTPLTRPFDLSVLIEAAGGGFSFASGFAADTSAAAGGIKGLNESDAMTMAMARTSLRQMVISFNIFKSTAACGRKGVREERKMVGIILEIPSIAPCYRTEDGVFRTEAFSLDGLEGLG